MGENELAEFIGIWRDVCEFYEKPMPSDLVVKMTFTALSAHSIERVRDSIMRHMQNKRSGKFLPKPADLLAYLEADDLTVDQIIAAARLKETPFGVMAAIRIGSHDLDNQTEFYLRQRAEEIIQILPKWKEHQGKGKYTDHEMLTLMKYKVAPTMPFLANMKAPGNVHELKLQFDRVRSSDDYKALQKPSDGEQKIDKEGLKKIQELIGDLTDAKNELS